VSSVAGTVRLPRPERIGKVTQARVALSEWTKLRSLRSTRWSLLAAMVLTIGLPSLFAAILAARWGHLSPQERAGHRHRPVEVALAGVNVSQLAIAVLGVLVITGEYSTGMIRASFLAVPRRLPVLWAKTAVYAVVAFVLMLPSVLIAFFASQAILARHHILQIPFSHPGVGRAVIGGAVYLMLVGIFALAIGAIVRNTAGGIATFAAIFFVIPAAAKRAALELEQRHLALPARQRRPLDLYAHPRLAQPRSCSRVRTVRWLLRARACDSGRATRPPRHEAELTRKPVAAGLVFYLHARNRLSRWHRECVEDVRLVKVSAHVCRFIVQPWRRGGAGDD